MSFFDWFGNAVIYRGIWWGIDEIDHEPGISGESANSSNSEWGLGKLSEFT